MSRKICITAADGQTGFLIAELLLTNPDFNTKYDALVCLTLHPDSERAKELEKLGATIVEHKPGKEKAMADTLKKSGADTICLIPPTHENKYDITTELIAATKRAGVQNVCLISSAGADLATMEKQPRLREFVEFEQEVMKTKGDKSTETGHSPCVIRAGFYMENLLNYAPQAQQDSVLPLPIGKSHKFAPMALGDVALVAAHVLTGKGEHGFDDKHRGQLIVLTGPMLAAGEELATAATQALGKEMHFEDISEREAKRVLQAQSTSDASELQYLLEYYSLVREGKTNYISTLAFHDVTGQQPQEPTDFFKIYEDEFKGTSGQGGGKRGKKEDAGEEGDGKETHQKKKRKTNGK